MGAQRPMQSSARHRYFKRRLKRSLGLLTAGLILAGIVGGGLAYPVLAPDSSRWSGPVITPTVSPTAESMISSVPETSLPTPETPTEAVLLTTEATPTQKEPGLPLPTQARNIPPSDDPSILYYTVAGDSLAVVSLRFGVNVGEVKSPMEIDHHGLLPPG